MNLDLGGTWSEPPKGTVSISLDGSHVDEVRNMDTGRWEVRANCQQVIGDFNRMPFKSGSFKKVWGSCYLEGSDTNEPLNWEELARVAAKKCTITVSQCSTYLLSHPKKGIKNERDMFKDAVVVGQQAALAGLVLRRVELRGNTSFQNDEVEIDTPSFVFVKKS